MTISIANTAGEPHEKSRLVDTHCHLDDPSFEHDLGTVIQRAHELGVTRCINVGYEPSRWRSSMDLASRFPGISVMLGMHPGYANGWSPDIRRQMVRLIQNAHPIAIGEIGLDFYRGETNVQQQTAAFVEQLALAQEHGLPAVIHMRNAEDQVLAALQAQASLPPLLFHSFEGSRHLGEWIVESGSYVGVGGLATRKKSEDLREILTHISLDRIVLETDSPYLVPNGFKHRRNTPESIPVVARSLAMLFDSGVNTIAHVTTSNAERLFERLPAS